MILTISEKLSRRKLGAKCPLNVLAGFGSIFGRLECIAYYPKLDCRHLRIILKTKDGAEDATPCIEMV